MATNQDFRDLFAALNAVGAKFLLVGGYAVALASREGLRVVAIGAAADESFLRSAGADVFIARGNDVAARVRQAVPQGVDAVVDAAGLFEQIATAAPHNPRANLW